MRFNTQIYARLSTLLLTLIIATTATANEASENNSIKNHVNLSIKPIACVVKNIGEQCQLTVTAHWQSTQPIDACLYQNDNKLSCWQQQQQATKRLDIAMSNDMIFTLRSPQDDVIAQRTIKINVSQSDQYRRRLRAQWSLF